MTDTKPFEGKLALVTGASRGIGAATAEALAEAGAHVILTARGASALEQVEERIHATGGNDAAAKVAKGEAEIAIVLISEIGEAKGAKLAAPLPGPTQLWMDYSAAIPASSTDPANAKALVSALTSPAMRARWIEAGWEPASK